MSIRRAATIATVMVASLTLAACASTEPVKEASKSAETTETSMSDSSVVTLVTHDSFKVDEKLIAQLKTDTGITLKTVAADSGAKMVSQLTLKKNSPIGDAVYGIDTNVMGAVASAGLVEDSGLKPVAGAEQFADPKVPGAVPIDRGDVCLNYDIKYFKDKGLTPPNTFEDLAKPEYKGLLVAIDPGESTTGLAFLTGTVQKFGDGWKDYWTQLKANDVKIVSGWTEAYQTEFTAGEGKGTYPIVVSYASSPSYSVNEAGTEAATASVLNTCYPQVEYAGVLTNAKNPEGAKKVIEWLQSKGVQEDIPNNMYMYPIDPAAAVPDAMKKFAPLPNDTKPMDSEQVENNRATWIKDFKTIFGG
ncbi:thiamine ABC transporter substrate-binding protein [Boudabousia marimammalium]|uniref:Thiamine ABC transporter substrate-binding protein n=1 Tax=Boudabousia marimammalium TaxID=156892 RepID=A0A1Q5PM24_9ACTO|nr:thiamine ABC transporter substrate-binding protein [Boudabousia marimammalium]OKL48104.1 hypothetical protein BM477_06500 [Boudabousia marimammalium]